MRLNIFEKYIPEFGLDLDSESVKAVEISKSPQGLVLSGIINSKLPKGLFTNDNITDSDALGRALGKVFDKPDFGHFSTNHVVLNLPESKSFVRVIHIPIMSDAEIENAIPFEAESYIPIPIDQVYLDWQKLSQVNDKMEILLIASPKEFVDKLIAAVEFAGFTPTAVEVESQSLCRALIQKNSTETLLIADIAATRTDLIMVEKGNLQFTSSIPIAGATFTESIARDLGVAPSKAEEIKFKVGLANSAEYPNIRTTLLPVLNNLVAEIKNILIFHDQHSEIKPSKILLSGGGARMSHLIDFFSPEFSEIPGLKVELANPWININVKDQVKISNTDGLNLATPVGLALRNLF